MAGKIVLGYDGSDGAKAALAQVEWLAKDLGASVVVAFGYATNPLGGENRDEEMAVRDLAAKITGEAVSALTAHGVDVTVEIVQDRPADAILDVAAEHAARLIVVGTNGQSPILGGILGSVPYRLVHVSPIPVLVVPATGRATARPTAAADPTAAPGPTA